MKSLFNIAGGGCKTQPRNKGSFSLELITIVLVVIFVALLGLRAFGGQISNTIHDSTNTVASVTDNVLNQYNGSGGSGSGGSGSSESENYILIDATNFPDATFRIYVSTNFDTDSDGKLSLDERNTVTNVGVGNKAITSLKGIEYFTSMTSLDCHSNQLTTLDLSENTELQFLDCSTNQLTTLDLSNNTELIQMGCMENQITTLDLTHNPSLNSSNVYVDNTVSVTYAS